MTGFYSMVVLATDEVGLPEHHLLLVPGINTFNLQIEDVDAFCADLVEQGCRIHALHRLDVSEDEIPELPV